MSETFDLRDCDHFACGAVGPAGKRTFFLQARGGGELVTLKIEKQQAAGLARYLAGLLSDQPEPDDVVGGQGLIEPIVAEWAVGAIGVAFDDASGHFVVAAEELVDEDDDLEPGRARFHVPPGRVRAFIDHTEELVEAGRPPCPICGGPLDPDGHVCPRSNGHGVH